jgi:hypothetical protein
MTTVKIERAILGLRPSNRLPVSYYSDNVEYYITLNTHTVTPVYKGHSREFENAFFVRNGPLNTG